MEKEWATFTTTIVAIGATEEVRRPTRMMPSWVPQLFISASVAAESKSSAELIVLHAKVS